MSTKRVFFTGATGYIGGAVLAKLVESSNYDVYVLIRDKSKAAKFEQLGLHVVIGSFSDLDVLKGQSALADIVIHTADADGLDAAKAIHAGQASRLEKNLPKGIYIHTSGTGVLSDDARGMHSDAQIYDDLDERQLATLKPSQPHRNVDLFLLDSENMKKVRTFIILPSTIYGVTSHQFVQAGLSNPLSIQIPTAIQVAINLNQVGTVGKGLNHWPCVHIDDQAQMFIDVLNTALKEQKSDEGGYIFGENGEYNLLKAYEGVAKSLKKHGAIKTEDVRSLTDDEVKKLMGSYYLGGNSRCKSNKARRDYGWKPKYGLDDFYNSFDGEVEFLLAHPERKLQPQNY